MQSRPTSVPTIERVARWKKIAGLVWKYHDAPAQNDETSPASQLAHDLEEMGPAYVKLGQVLSSRPDLLPPPYTKSLARLQDDVKPFSFEEVRVIVEAELGARLSKLFATFDPE